MKNKGLTLLELIIGLGIFSLVVTVSGMLFKSTIKTYITGNEVSASVNEAEAVFFDVPPSKGLLWEIRQSSAVFTLNGSTLSLCAPYGTARFYLSSGNLIKQTTSGVETTARGIESLEFGYYQTGAGALPVSATSSSSTAIVSITATSRKGNKSFKLSSTAKLRNR